MKRPTDEQILSFLDGTADVDSHEAVLEWTEASADHAAEMRLLAAGREASHAWREGTAFPDEAISIPAPRAGRPNDMASSPGRATGGDATRPRRRVPASWLPLTAAAAVALSVPVTLAFSTRAQDPLAAMSFGQPAAADPSFMVVLQGVWPDAGGLRADVVSRRAEEYWAWTTELATRGLLVAAGDLRWEPGLQIEAPIGGESDDEATVIASGDGDTTAPTSVGAPDFLVGILAIRASSYEEASRIASECPHLRYGGTVSVRRVGGGFVTVPGMDDWGS